MIDPYNSINQWRKQRLFDTIATHLLKQGRKASDHKGGCCYRLRDDKTGEMLKCAVGYLIPDEAYSPLMEDNSITSDFVRDFRMSCKVADIREGDVGFLSEIQNIHDFCNPAEWRQQLYIFAKVNDLSFDVLFADFHLPGMDQGVTYDNNDY